EGWRTGCALYAELLLLMRNDAEAARDAYRDSRDLRLSGASWEQTVERLLRARLPAPDRQASGVEVTPQRVTVGGVWVRPRKR
ncbi:MAG: hypothetical protein AB1758_37895, partial [Candidatus Eremiobacterota bacterium]